jgi:hypothetical protein
LDKLIFWWFLRLILRSSSEVEMTYYRTLRLHSVFLFLHLSEILNID